MYCLLAVSHFSRQIYYLSCQNVMVNVTNSVNSSLGSLATRNVNYFFQLGAQHRSVKGTNEADENSS